MPAFQPDIEGRFWRRVNKKGPIVVPQLGPCWIWTAQLNNKGYGVFGLSRPRRAVYAHRYSWEQYNHTVPVGMVILHRCDNPACVNPTHLRLGTRKDNMQDAASKFRVSTCKLTQEQIDEIRLAVQGHQSYGLTKIYCKKFGVHRSTIRRAVKHLTHKGPIH